MTPYCVVLCTCPDSAVAERIALHLTEKKLVACTNIIPHLQSIYLWQEKVTEGAEVLMMMKTHQSKLTALEEALVSVHPYQFPEFIALPILYGNSRYLSWVDEVVGTQDVTT